MTKAAARRPLRQRIVALTAAYAIVLAGLIASFTAARAAAVATAQPDLILCHAATTGQPAPDSDGGNGRTCVDNCCIGCLVLTAALPAPAAEPTALLRTAGETIAPLPRIVLADRPETAHKRSRAPPFGA